MSAHLRDEERKKEVEELIGELSEQNLKIPIIVEGGKDIRALRKLGFSGRIIKINRGVTLMCFAEMVAKECKEVILLTDWDKKGCLLADELSKLFDSLGVKYDLTYRQALIRLLRQEIKDIESLYTYFEKIEDE